MNKLSVYADDMQLNLYKNFPSTHFLSNSNNVLHVLAWGTFFRRNMHRFVIDYLKIQLYEYQAIAIYMMGICNFICIIASRNDAKSFIVAVYAVARCLLYKGTKFRIGASTEKQAKLIVSEKIMDELCEWSPILRREIKDYSIRSSDIYVKFRNGSKITVFVANENARGLRSNAICREECRQIKKKVEDSVISPFQTPRKPQYMFKPEYKNNKQLKEQPIDIYISSSWYDDGNWMWDISEQALKAMKEHKGGLMLAFDESIAIKHELKTIEQLIKEKKKQDPATWKIEFLNLKVRDSLSSYFTYSMLMNCQVSKYVFYPRTTLDYKSHKKNKYLIPKLDNEIRIISNDFAFVAGNQNDNSVYSCIRGIPESITYENENHTVEIKRGYRRSFSYMESNQMGDTTLQAIRIRQLYEDFDADYIVVDARSGGSQVVYALQKVLYDEERGVEYSPLKVMNNDEYAKVCSDPNAPACIYVINATQVLNSDIAIAFRKNLIENKIEFLVSLNIAQQEILSSNQDYISSPDTDVQIEYERPFLETQAMINECAELQYEKMPQTGIIKIHEQGKKRKDRYTSCSYGSYFFDQLELDSFCSSSDYEYATFIN
ncbi:hypothetical protein H8S37_04585 [Mediterraneibacter sp. NSJ-55]|uniref:Terminase n=2 Tax=Mediterraneibacter hominis TaxID=2763054 RepID=A0A923LH64_9FIRM|nr:hypothetical protein [Mediterraneibacter hominis]